MKPRDGLLAVVVLYRCAPAGAAPVLALVDRIARHREAGRRVRLECLVYDNSPAGQRVELLALIRERGGAAGDAVVPDTIGYVHDADNGGTRAAYACALRRAADRDLAHLVAFDQDTAVAADYLARLEDEIDHRPSGGDERSVPVAWLPVVRSHGRRVSPSWSLHGLVVRRRPTGALGRLVSHRTAIASGAMFEAAALRATLPWPPALWLDGLDHWLFHALAATGRPVVALDAVLEHDLSVAGDVPPSPARLKSRLDGERAYCGALGRGAVALLYLRLTWRLARGRFGTRRNAGAVLRWMLGRERIRA